MASRKKSTVNYLNTFPALSATNLHAFALRSDWLILLSMFLVRGVRWLVAVSWKSRYVLFKYELVSVAYTNSSPVQKGQQLGWLRLSQGNTLSLSVRYKRWPYTSAWVCIKFVLFWASNNHNHCLKYHSKVEQGNKENWTSCTDVCWV